MQKAQELMEGPLQKCRLYSKIDRWEAQIAAAIADDQAAGIYPAIGGQHPNFAESVGYLKGTQVPQLVELFRKGVACGEGGSKYSPDDWGDMYSVKVGEMLDSNVFQGLAGWGGGGPRAAPLALIIVGAVIVVLVLVVCIIKRKAAAKCCHQACSPSAGSAAPVAASMTMTSEQLNPGFNGATTKVRVDVPPGTAAGQSLLVNAPGGGVLVVKIPPKCSAFSLTVPANEPASRTVALTAKEGKLGISLMENRLTQGAMIATVGPGSAAADAGVALNEQVVTINGTPVPLGPNAKTAGFNMLSQSAGSCTLELTTWTPSITILPPAGAAMA